MNNITKIILSDSKQEIILDESYPQELEFSYTDVRELTTRGAGASKELKVQGSKAHNRIFSHLFDVQIDNQIATFDLQIKHPCIIVRQGESILEGWLQLLSVNIDGRNENKKISYNVRVYDDTSNLYNEIGENLIEDLDFSQWDHKLSYSAITRSWTATTEEIPYYYPILNSDYNLNLITKLFKPAFYAKNITDSIFRETGFSYESDFFDSYRYKNFVIPFASSGDLPTLTQDEVERRKFSAAISAATNIITAGDIGNKAFPRMFTQVPYIGPIRFNSLISEGEVGSYDTSNSTITFDREGVHTFTVKYRLSAQLQFSSGSLATVAVEGGAHPYLRTKIGLNFNGDTVGNSSTPRMKYESPRIVPFSYKNTWNVGDSQTKEATIEFTFENVKVKAGDVIKPYGINKLYYPNGTFNIPPANFVVFNLTINSTTTDSDFSNLPQKTELSEYDTIELNKYLPQKFKWKEYFTSQIKMFNLVFVPKVGESKKILVQPYDDFYNSGTVINLDDPSEKIKIDYSKPIEIKHAPELVSKEILFTYKDDSSDALKSYKDNLKRTYGEQRVTFPVEYLSQKKVIQPEFSPTPTIHSVGDLKYLTIDIDTEKPKSNYRFLNRVSYPHSATTLTDPHLNDDYMDVNRSEAIAFNYRTDPSQSDVNARDNLYTIHSAHHFDNVISPKFDLNYGQNPYYMYNEFSAITENNLYNLYWTRKINQLPNQKLWKGSVYIPLNRIKNFQFNELFLFEGESWIINRIKSYNIKNSMAIVEFLSYERTTRFTGNQNQPELRLTPGEAWRESGKDKLNFGSNSYSDGLNLIIGPENEVVGSGNIMMGERNIANSQGSLVTGEGNQVNGSNNIVIGSGNTIQNDSTILIGNNLDISGGTEALVIGNSYIDRDGIGVFTGATINGLTADTLTVGSISATTLELTSGATPFSGNPINGAILPVSGSNTSTGSYSFVAGGQGNTASGNYSHAEGYQTTATTIGDHSEGYQTLASGNYGSHAEGYATTASNWASHAEGGQTIASGTYSHAEGRSTLASSDDAHAEGRFTSAVTINAHAEGNYTLAQGTSSHAEGRSTKALGNHSHAEGYVTTASGFASHAGGSNNAVIGNFSSAIGGSGNTINSEATGTTILGGQNITATSANTTYTQSLVLTNPQPVPATSGDTGTKGTIAYDDDYLYVCYQANSWFRISGDKIF